jgi:hypothetical protein
MANKEPLTPAQQKWAAQYLPLARGLAKKYKFDDVTVFYEAKVVAEKPTRREVRILNHRSNNYLWSGCIHAPSELGRYW